MFSDDLEYRRAIHFRVGNIFETRLQPILERYRYCCGNFVVKEPSPQSVVPLHQDWTIIDPRSARSINVICPLIETHETNGQLCVVPGSHHEPSRISFGPQDRLQIEQLLPMIQERYLRRLFQKAGEALLYDGRLLHASGPNQTDRVRVCFSAGLIPEEASLRHYFKDPASPDTLDVYDIDDDFFWQHKIGQRPQRGTLLETVSHSDVPVSEETLLAWSRATIR
jgi:hypothetical protein